MKTFDPATHKVVPKGYVVMAEWELELYVMNAVDARIKAETKPPRIDEPGLWGVVEASVETHGKQRGRFVRDGHDYSGHYWECLDWSGTYGWEYLVDPTLIREGVES